MKLEDHIGETTSYDKKLMLERKDPTSWLKSVSAFANTKMMWRKTNDGRMNYPEYPERAYEEGLVNALIHRDYLEIGSEVHIDIYDDRMEIVSPGGMPSGKRVQELDLRQVSSMRRNPVIADLFQRLVPRPVEAVHCELDRGRVHGEHGGLDPKAAPPVGPVSELRGDPREVVVHLPV